MLNKLVDILQKDLPAKLFNKIQQNYDDNHELCSIFLRYDNDKLLSQFTVWYDLSCHIEICDIQTEQYIKCERLELEGVDKVKQKFDAFLYQIGVL